MQSRSLKPRETYPKHSDFAIVPLDSGTSYSRSHDTVGARKNVIGIGCGDGYIGSLFLKRECDVVGIDVKSRLPESTEVAASVESAQAPSLESEALV